MKHDDYLAYEATDDELLAWQQRHNCLSRIAVNDLRQAFDDARTAHLLEPPTENDDDNLDA